MHSTQRNGLYLMGLGVVMIAGMAFAADARFDEADANVNKAIALLKAAEIPAGKPRAVALAARRASTASCASRGCCAHAALRACSSSGRGLASALAVMSASRSAAAMGAWRLI